MCLCVLQPQTQVTNMNPTFKPQPKINSFFKPVSNRMHQARMLQENVMIEERSTQLAAEKEAKKEAKADKLAAERKVAEESPEIKFEVCLGS